MVLPWRDENPTSRTAVVTLALIAINVVAFLLSPASTTPFGPSTAAAVCHQADYYEHWGAVPKELLSGDRVVKVTRYEESGVVRSCPVDKRPKSILLSVFTAMFVHGGWLHLLGNMLFLWVFGNNVEDRFGRLRYLLFYLGCGVAATYGHAALSGGSTESLVGASGAIAGVLGAYLVLFPRVRVLSSLTFLFFLPLRLPAWLVLGGWFLLQYLYFRGAGLSAGAGVAYGAHVVGFLVGLLFALVVRAREGHAR